MQVAEAPVPASVQGLPVNAPVPLELKLTNPVGGTGLVAVSVTVTVQVAI